LNGGSIGLLCIADCPRRSGSREASHETTAMPASTLCALTGPTDAGMPLAGWPAKGWRPREPIVKRVVVMPDTGSCVMLPAAIDSCSRWMAVARFFLRSLVTLVATVRPSASVNVPRTMKQGRPPLSRLFSIGALSGMFSAVTLMSFCMFCWSFCYLERDYSPAAPPHSGAASGTTCACVCSCAWP
jgi:hypothetical protein